MRRFVSIMLIITLISSMLGGLTACSSNNDKAYITKGEWLSMINASFGMYNAISEEPQVKGIDNTNPYFKDVQIASEWEVIDTTKALDVNDNVDKLYAIETLVNAGEFCPKDSSQDELIQAAIDKGFLVSGIESKLGLSSDIERTNAIDMLNQAQDSWVNKTYDGVIEETSFLNGVKDFTKTSSLINNVSTNNNVTELPTEEAKNLNIGDIYILPATVNEPFITAKKVENIVINGDRTLITNSTQDLSLEEYVDKIFVQETYQPNLLSGGQILDGNGNPITYENEATLNGANNNTPNLQNTSNLLYKSNSETDVKNISLLKSGTLSFTLDKWTVEGKISSDGMEFSVKKSIYEEKAKGIKKSSEIFGKVAINNFKVTNDMDYSNFTLHSATSKVDSSIELSGGLSGAIDKTALKTAPYDNRNGDLLSNFSKIGITGGSKDGAESITICSIPIATAGVIRLNLEVKLMISVSGDITISLSIDSSKGVEFKNNNIRYINSNGIDLDIKAKASVEPTICIGLVIKIFNIKLLGFNANIGFGVSFNVTMNVVDSDNHLLDQGSMGDVEADLAKDLSECGGITTVDAIKKIAEKQGCTYDSTENELADISLHFDLCFELKLYPVVKVGIDSGTLAGKLLQKLGINLSVEILGEDDAWGTAHIESLNDLSSWSKIKECFSKECSKKYNPFNSKDDKEKSTEVITTSNSNGNGNSNANANTNSNGNSNSNIRNNTLIISAYELSINVGGNNNIKVTGLPDGYSANDIIFESLDSSIAIVDKNGLIVGKKAGITNIRIYTKDNKISTTCAIFINSTEKETFKPI